MTKKKTYKSKASKKAEEASAYSRILVYVLMLYFPFFLLMNLLRLWGFGFSIEDLGVFQQIVANTAHGDFFHNSIKYPYIEDGHWLGIHFIALPIILTVPIYLLFPCPEVFSFIHIFLVCATSVIVYKTCRKINLSADWACFWALIYLFNPMTLYHAMFSYQDASFSTPLIALGFYFLLTRKLLWLWIIAISLVLTKEHYGLTVGGFGLLWWAYHKNFKQGFALSAFGGISFLLVLFVIMPYFSPYGEHYMLSTNSEDHSYVRYQWLRGPFLEVLSLFPEKLFTIFNARYLLGLLLPLVFLPLGMFVFILPLAPDIILTLISEYKQQKMPFYYYSAPLIPPLIIMSAITLSRFKSKKKMAGTVAVSTAIFCFMVMSIPVSKIGLLTNPGMDWNYGKLYQDAVAQIPEDAWLISDTLSSLPITSRKRVFGLIPEAYEKANYALLRVSPYHFSIVNSSGNEAALVVSQAFLAQKNWGLIYWKYPYAVFKRNAVSTADTADLKRVTDYYLKLQKGKGRLSGAQ